MDFNLGDIERRFFPIDLTELRADDGDIPKIEGYAVVYEKWSEDLGGFREIIHKGAGARAVKKSDVRALWNHDPNIVLGRTRAGTLELTDTDEGVLSRIMPPSWASGYIETIKRKDVNQMSFAFSIPKDGEKWTYTDKEVTREIFEFYPMYDVSPVTYPAYPQTKVGVRDLLSTEGIDLDAIAGIMFRAHRGCQLRPVDRDLIDASIDVLKRIATPRGQGTAPGAADRDNAQGRIILLRQQLQLLELQYPNS